MKALIVALALALLVVSPAAAELGTGTGQSFSSSSPSANTVRATFTVERNRAYELEMFDANGLLVCDTYIYPQYNGIAPGSTFSLVCFASSAAAYSALFTIDHPTKLIPTFTWSTG